MFAIELFNQIIIVCEGQKEPQLIQKSDRITIIKSLVPHGE
jgi:hypothetical protein